MARLHVAILLLVAVVGSIQCDHTGAQVKEFEVTREVPVENGEKAESDPECPCCGFCYGKPDGNYVYPPNNHFYYKCSCGQTQVVQCPCGMIFCPCSHSCVPGEEKDDCENNQKAAVPKLRDVLKL